MNVIYYQTKTKFTNTGDVLINKAMIEMLRNYGNIKCNCENNIPDYFINELDIKESEKIKVKNEFSLAFDILKTAKKLNKNGNKVYIVSGLGHTFGNGIKKNIRNIIAYIFFSIYKLYGVKIVRIGISLGPLGGILSKTEKIRSKKVDYYYVRDTKSLELCNEIGINNARLCPDLSWIYDNKNKRKFNPNQSICINLRKSILDNDEPLSYLEAMLKRCSDILNILNYDKSKKLFFCYQVDEDKEFSKFCYNYFNSKYDCVYIEDKITLFSAGNIYSKCSFNISNRMHSLLLGYKYGALPIALIDQKKHIKIHQTLKDNGLEKLSIDVYRGNDKSINYINNNSKKLASKLFLVEKERQKEILNILDRIFEK